MFQLFKRSDRRASTRHDVQGVQTRFGQVMNISPDGALLLRKGKLTCEVGDKMHVVVHHEGHEIDLPCAVAWVQQVGFHQFEVGVRFTNLSERSTRDIHWLIESASLDYSPPAYIAA
jgi:hypothetical protein